MRIFEKITNVDLDDDRLMLTCESGRQIVIEHRQDCCEHVWFEDGDWMNIVGRVVSDISLDCEDLPEASESGTITNVQFKFDDGECEVLRWFGESNGYYSETVDVDDITMNIGDCLPNGWKEPNYWDYQDHKKHRQDLIDFWTVCGDWWEEQGDLAKANACRYRFDP